jgi:hypothetical protein
MGLIVCQLAGMPALSFDGVVTVLRSRAGWESSISGSGMRVKEMRRGANGPGSMLNRTSQGPQNWTEESVSYDSSNSDSQVEMFAKNARFA